MALLTKIVSQISKLLLAKIIEDKIIPVSVEYVKFPKTLSKQSPKVLAKVYL